MFIRSAVDRGSSDAAPRLPLDPPPPPPPPPSLAAAAAAAAAVSDDCPWPRDGPPSDVRAEAVLPRRLRPDSGSGWPAAAAVPSVDPRVFDKMFNDSLQDLLMIVYLSQLTRTQLAIAEKLTTAS